MSKSLPMATGHAREWHCRVGTVWTFERPAPGASEASSPDWAQKGYPAFCARRPNGMETCDTPLCANDFTDGVHVYATLGTSGPLRDRPSSFHSRITYYGDHISEASTGSQRPVLAGVVAKPADLQHKMSRHG